MLLSGKIYLTTLYRLQKEGGRVRSVEVARHLGYTKPSVSRAVSSFAKEGYLTVEKGGILTLTPKGEKLARSIADRQDLIAEFLSMTCSVDQKEVLPEAVAMEECMKKETFEGMKDFVDQVKKMREGNG